MAARPAILALALILFATACGGAGRQVGRDVAPNGGETGSSDIAERLLIVPREGWRTDFENHTVPLIQIVRGGPGKDGIPSVDTPRYVGVDAAAQWLEPDEPVIELELEGHVRAYPLQILVWHEIVNDELGGVPVVVTFCPLCNSAVAFERQLDGEQLDFGVTGNLRFSDLVMYDRQTETWWQQLSGEAIVGELAGARLSVLPARIVAWERFASAHPDATVLSRETGHARPYGANPYPGYDDVRSPPFFGVPNASDDRLAAKERVVFVELGKEALAVPFSALEEARRLEADVGGEELEIVWLSGVRSPLASAEGGEGRTVGSASVRRRDSGELVPFDTPFWFVVAAFRPDVRVWPDPAPWAEPSQPARRCESWVCQIPRLP